MSRRRAVSMLALLVGVAEPALAGLGQPVSSVAVDEQRLRGQRRSVAGQDFQVEEIASADGILVREFVGATGEVFGVAWEGQAVPDLELLLGEHFAEFERAARMSTRRHRPLVVRTEGLVVEMGGHMRGLHGRAYLPALVPETVSESVVR